MDTKLTELEKVFGQYRVRVNEPMSVHTTYKIGGPAEYYIDLEKTDDIIKAVNAAKKLELALFIFGGGSNIVVADHGIKGLVVKNNCRKFDIMTMSGRVKNQKIDVDRALVFVESGAIMNQFVRFTIDQGFGGLEYQLGLPGTVGGAVYMNSNYPRKSAYVGDFVYRAKLVTPDGEVKEVDNSYFHFAYDYSVLQETGEIVLSVIFRLNPWDKNTLWDRATDALTHRNESQPKGASAGCTFRNISIVEALRIPTPDQITSAGYLIDKAGLKGKRIGDAMISDKHANFILNMGNAKAEDFIALTTLMKDEVARKFGVKLHLEVKTVGF